MDEDRERNSQGRFTAEHDVTAEDVYEAMDQFEPYTSREIADNLDIPRRTAYKFLNDLADAGLIRKKKPEPRRAIWIRNEE
ncbi:helix-turn-helix domain-containing protein [Natronolimnohabitans innermongolicus]|uniref:Transcription regulator TrmB N-terminal domain-containing protein n=1 Tax=Natronolimnohabitans innermongolicus JCM 12255 TaxID=1227499 RepID=L9WX74_9EURY|nr:helix-turn-helix domain-containing protein [Natronolimnohabitans innermongolicus]ELY53997.1 hypothetical protein C493_13143 [Natronolimnohabitans innermongolicus JCM 12255]